MFNDGRWIESYNVMIEKFTVIALCVKGDCQS